MCRVRMINEIRSDALVVPSLILQAFSYGAVPKIEVARQSRGACQMRLAIPHLVVAAGIAISFIQPGAVLMSGRLLCLIDGHDHGGQKRRLRASQVVSAIGVQKSAVML